MNLSRYPMAVAGIAAALALSACNADWEHIFSSHDSDSADNTVDVQKTDIAGLNVVESSSSFADTYSSLINAISGQTTRVVALDLQARANGTSFSNESGTAIDGSDDSGPTTGTPPGTATGGTGAVGQTGVGTTSPTTSSGSTGVTGTAGPTGVDTGTGSTATGTTDTTTANTASGTTSDSNDLRPTRVILFDNPSRSTPVLQADAEAGLDVPVAMLVYQDDSGSTGIAYDDEDYLKARYDVDDADDALDAIADNLKTLAQDAAANDIDQTGSATGTTAHEGIVAHGSSNDFNTTLTRLRSAIDADSGLDYIVQIDHQAAASSVGLDLNPSVLVLFDARDDDAALLGSNQTVGIDLPQRILVTQDDDGDVHLYYNDPAYLADRHKIGASNKQTGERLDDLSNTLSDLVDSARRSGN